MSDGDSNRRRLVIAVFVGVVLVGVGSLAGAGTYAWFTDSEVDSAGTISVVKNNQTPVVFKANCKKADITPADPTDFVMTVTLVNGTSETYNETDLNPNNQTTFTYETKNHWPNANPAPKMANITLDGTTYESSCA